jgi:hypothetical protein
MRSHSFTELSCFQACPRRYKFAYVDKLVPREKSKALSFGIDFHRGVANEPLDPNTPASLAYNIGQLALKHFGPVEHPEVRLFAALDNLVSVQSKVDGVLPDAVVEYKTTSRCNPSNYTALQLSLQNRLGCFMHGREHLRLRICRKSAIRLRQHETDEEFDARYLQEYINDPDKHFMEIICKPERLNLMELKVLHDMIRHCEDTNTWPQTAPGSCYSTYACNYMPLCQDYETNKLLFDTKPENAEVPNEED